MKSPTKPIANDKIYEAVDSIMYSIEICIPLLLMSIISFSIELNKHLELFGFSIIGLVTIYNILEDLKNEPKTN